MDKKVHAFPKGINPKVNKMTQLELELAPLMLQFTTLATTTPILFFRIKY